MANVEAAFKNLHQDLIDGCKTGDQKAQFRYISCTIKQCTIQV